MDVHVQCQGRQPRTPRRTFIMRAVSLYLIMISVKKIQNEVWSGRNNILQDSGMGDRYRQDSFQTVSRLWRALQGTVLKLVLFESITDAMVMWDSIYILHVSFLLVFLTFMGERFQAPNIILSKRVKTTRFSPL